MFGFENKYGSEESGGKTWTLNITKNRGPRTHPGLVQAKIHNPWKFLEDENEDETEATNQKKDDLL